MRWGKKKEKRRRGNNALEGDVTEDNKGRGGDGMEAEAEAGKRAVENEDKNAKKTGQRKKRKPQ